ncbi:D-Ala-D-Ala carboxypeptidase family metallohydrolase [Photobacterium rosenbergii]|uniref:D-Ala-D-Ala carboxypeptidase family metallohydrolase n=1 Tax=Photobacterium rosenbergii TaxID=294936 RepID=UPI0021BD8A55|nr:D-Ala-D-Ala carboxypeptidase family metallohydrolase [Photobacterium rosenbergii]
MKWIMLSLLLGFSSASQAEAVDLSKLYEVHTDFDYSDLVVEVQGFKVPTLAAFRGWVLMNRKEKEIQEGYKYFLDNGVKEGIPLHLILLQGTDWRLSNTTVFNLPDKKNWDNMVRTLLFIQEHVMPKTGLLIPVSGDRSKEYNQHAGGAPRSSHLDFCALDMVPIRNISRTELHKILMSVYNKVGRKNNMGLGLYSGVRFHIDTCGHRSW